MKLDTTIVEWLVTSVRTSRLGFDSRSQKSGDTHFFGFHEEPAKARFFGRFRRLRSSPLHGPFERKEHDCEHHRSARRRSASARSPLDQTIDLRSLNRVVQYFGFVNRVVSLFITLPPLDDSHFDLFWCDANRQNFRTSQSLYCDHSIRCRWRDHNNQKKE